MSDLTYRWSFNHWERKTLDRMKRDQRVSSASAGISRGQLRDRVDDLEAELRFVSLLNRALMEVLFERGTTTKEELVAIMKTLDLEDGQEDDGLTTEALAEGMGFAKPGLSNAEKLRRAAESMTKSSRVNRRRR